MVKSSEVLKDISKWSYDGSIEGREGYFNLIYWGEGEDKGKIIEPEERGENWKEIFKAFFKEIKQNPQDWKLGKKPNSDPYFECITVEHKSGRKHYTPEHHGIWGFNASDVREEWNEIKNILGKEKRENDKPNLPGEPQKSWWEKKATWLVVFAIIFLGLIIYVLVNRWSRKNKINNK